MKAKRIISMILCVSMLMSMIVLMAGAVSITNTCIRVIDTDGMTGYSATQDSLNAKIASEGGVTFVADVCVDSTGTAPEGQSPKLVAFTGGGGETKYNLLSYDFAAKQFGAGQSMLWISEPQTDYTAIAANPFEWESGRWYELAMRFNGNKAAIYLNGICVISTEFDAADTDYLIFHPQFCNVKVDNIKICAKDYNVAEETGTVWATENFNNISSVSDSAVWYADSYTLSGNGCNIVYSSLEDNCVRTSAFHDSGYSAAQDIWNTKIAEKDGVTLIADVLIEKSRTAREGFASQIVAFTGVYDENAKYNYIGYDIDEGAFEANESSQWLSYEQTGLSTEIASEAGTLEEYQWYEFAWKFDGNLAKMYVDGVEMVSANFSSVETGYIILYPQYCDVRIDNIRLCDKDFDPTTGVGTVWAREDYADAVSYDTSDVWYVDGGAYTISTLGAEALNLGDANNDGSVDSVDSATLTRVLQGINMKYGEGADVDLNGSIDSRDMAALLKILGGQKYSVDVSFDVVPVSPDNSAVVDGNQGGGTDNPDPEPPVSTEPVVTDPPATEPPVTDPPVSSSEPVVTDPPATEPPVSDPAVTTATPYDPSAPVDNGSGNTAGLDSSALKFNTMSNAAYTLLFSDQGQSYPDMRLTFDVFIESVNSAEPFAGLGVWNGNNNGFNRFVGYDFNSKRFTTSTDGYPGVPAEDNGPALNLSVGEWNRFEFRRLNNDTFEVYVNGKLYFTVTGQSFANTYYLFGFKNVVAYVDNYQYYHGDVACGLVTDFTTGASTDAAGATRFSDGGYWVVYGQSYEGVVSGQTTPTQPPVTDPPATEPPATEPPVTQPPVTDPAVTTATPYDPSAPVPNGSGNTAGIDGSALKFSGSDASYTFLFSDQLQSWNDMALSFDVFIESIDTTQDFAGLGVWNCNYNENNHRFVGYDFKDQRFTTAAIGYPTVPTEDSGPKMNLKVGEWNRFHLRRLNNNTFQIYVNGTLYYQVTNQNFANTFYLFGFKNLVAYVDNYQYFHDNVGQTLVTDFTTGSTKTDIYTKFADGGYWIVGEQGYDGVVKGAVGLDGSTLKFNGKEASSYTFALKEGTISNNDIALSFDVYVEDIDTTQDFAGLGVWNSGVGFVGYDFKDQKFTAMKDRSFPYGPDTDNGQSLALKKGEWNHFTFRRVNNNTFMIFVNGQKYVEVTGLTYTDTFFLFGFRGVTGYIDNYQAYENGVGKGLYTDFSKFTTNSAGQLVSPDGGYFIIGAQGFGGICTTVSGGYHGSGIAGTAAAAGSATVDGVGRIDLSSTVTPETTPPVTNPPTPSGNIGVSVADWNAKVTTGWELANRGAYIAKNYKTLYVMGCFGAPMTAKNKTRYTQNHSYNMQATRTAMINAASSDTFGFDCVCLIKGIMWGWKGALNTNYGGAGYAINGVSDHGSDATNIYSGGRITTGWDSMAIGEAVWMSGHIGIYIGNGLAVECTPAWENKVQITAVGKCSSYPSGYKIRNWTAHGKLNYVSY